jgi:hypothetical protein
MREKAQERNFGQFASIFSQNVDKKKKKKKKKKEKKEKKEYFHPWSETKTL